MRPFIPFLIAATVDQFLETLRRFVVAGLVVQEFRIQNRRSRKIYRWRFWIVDQRAIRSRGPFGAAPFGQQARRLQAVGKSCFGLSKGLVSKFFGLGFVVTGLLGKRGGVANQ